MPARAKAAVKPPERRELVWTELQAIQIDPRYQRAIHPERVAAMAKDWNMGAQSLSVNERSDGLVYCYDGLQRLTAARDAGLTHWWAETVYGLIWEAEAERFLLGQIRYNTQPVQRFKVELALELDRAMSINAIVASVGTYVQIEGTNRKDGIRAVAAMEEVWREPSGPARLLRSLRMLRRVWGNWGVEAYHRTLIQGMDQFYVDQAVVDEDRLADRLMRHHPIAFVRSVLPSHPGGDNSHQIAAGIRVEYRRRAA